MKKLFVTKLIVKASLIAVFLTGLLNLVEWQTGISPFKNLLSGYSSMRLITAILLILSTISLWSLAINSRRKVFLLRFTGIIVLYVSLITLGTYRSGIDPLQTDYFIFNFFLYADNRMALFTALIFLCLGIIYILFSYSSPSYDDIAHVMFFPALSLSYFVILSYILQISGVFIIQGIFTAPDTAFCLLLISTAVLLMKPDTWLMKILVGTGAGSIMGRKLIPWLLIIPVMISWAIIKIDQNNLLSDEVGAIMVAITYTLSFILLVWWSAYNVNRIDETRQQAYDTLFESESRLNALIRATTDVVYIMSPDWKQMYNQQGGNFLTSVETPVDDWMTNFIPPDAQPVVKETISKAIEHKSKFELEHQVISKEGSIGWIFSRAIPVLNADGSIKEWIGVAEDITEKVQSEIALRESQQQLQNKEKEEAMQLGAKNAMLKLNEELMRSNKELQQFAYLTSHDLQEPLRTITTYTEWLSKKLEGNLDAETDKILTSIVKSSLRLKTLITDLLTYSLIGSSTAPFTQVDLNQVFQNVINDLNQTIKIKDAKITCTVLPVVSGDEIQLFQLLHNLIDNALKFCTTTPVINVSSYQEADHFLFSVSDNGIGIDQKYNDKVFLIFQRLVNRHDYPGTGIGLAICKRIVERHGGNIFFSSKPNEGSTFYFSLPK